MRDGRYHMYFSYRHGVGFRNAAKGYRIGYACSTDGHSWERDDASGGLDVSSEGWDSEMVCYPHVLNIDGGLHIFYCGNSFGRDGFGYATLAE